MSKSVAYRKMVLGLGAILLALVFGIGIKSVYAADAISDALDRQIVARQQQIARFNTANTVNGAARESAVQPRNFSSAASLPPSSEESLQDSIRELQARIAQLEAAQTNNAVRNSAQRGSASSPIAVNPAPTANLGVPIRAPADATTAKAEGGPAVPVNSTPQTGAFEGTYKLKPGLTANLGGYFELSTIYRSKNESADNASNFNTAIPFNNSPNAHQSEFRETARNTRLIAQVGGNPDQDTSITGYLETDFAGAASTSSSTQTNGYTPRLRQAFLTYDQRDWGTHVLAGQAWSLATMTKTGLVPLTENVPMTIDSAYVVGFNFTRNPQLRLSQDFDDKKIWLGFSAESPQAATNGLACTANASTGTCAGYNSTYAVTNAANTSSFANPLSTDTAPDLIAKLAYDPGWGHYEAFSIMRFFHDSVNSYAHNNVVVGGGGGAGAILPLISKVLSIQGQFMIGNGIGRYGPTQMPDFAIMPNGALKPISEYMFMVGAVGHPDPTWDIYLYAGEEKVFRQNTSNLAYGYGDFLLNNSGCNTTGGSCSAQTSSVWQIVPGVWKRIYEGNYGKFQAGLQNSITRRNAFSDSHGSAPHAYEDIAMFSLRYYPF